LRKDFYAYARYGSIGISFVLAVCIYMYGGYAVGLWLDRRWHTQPLLTVCGLVLAMAMSLRTLFSLVTAADREMRAERDEHPDKTK